MAGSRLANTDGASESSDRPGARVTGATGAGQDRRLQPRLAASDERSPALPGDRSKFQARAALENLEGN